MEQIRICGFPGCKKPTTRQSKDYCNTHYRKMLAEGRRVIVRPTDAEKAVIVASYMAGQSTYKISAAIKMREDKIQYWLKKWGVSLRPVGFQKGHKLRFRGRKSERGYILIYRPDHPNARKDGYILEHRFVAAQTLERPLKKGEIAHHEDESKDNNAPGNIIAMSNGEHTKLHNPVRTRWAKRNGTRI